MRWSSAIKVGLLQSEADEALKPYLRYVRKDLIDILDPVLEDSGPLWPIENSVGWVRGPMTNTLHVKLWSKDNR